MRIPGLRGLPLRVLARRSVERFLDDDMTTFASALAFDGILALFPFLLFLVALLGFLRAPGLFEVLLAGASALLPRQVVEPVVEALTDARRQPEGGLLSFGILFGIWIASAGVRSTMHALNVAYDVGEDRPPRVRYPLSIVFTVVLAVVAMLAAVLMLVGPRVVGWLAGRIGLHEAFVTVWTWLRLPAAALLLMVAVALVYHFAPNLKRRFRLVTPGAVLAVPAWMAASLGFAYWLRTFARYEASYGSVSAAVVLLLYLFLSAAVLLLGAEVNAVVERHAADPGPGDPEPGRRSGRPRMATVAGGRSAASLEAQAAGPRSWAWPDPSRPRRPVAPSSSAAPEGTSPGGWHLPLLDALARAPFPALVHAEDGEVLRLSEAWTELSGYTLADLPTIAAWTDAAYGGRSHAARDRIRSLYGLRARVEEGEHRIRTRDGGWRVWSFCSAPLGVLPDGRRVVLSMAADVTGRVRAERKRRREERRWRFLARAGGVLSSTLGSATALRRMARVAVPALADACTVDVLGPDGSLARMAAAHRQPEDAYLLERAARVPLDPDGPLVRVLRTGRPEVVSRADREWVAADQEHARVLRRLRPRSVMLVPLVARGRTLGLVTFVAACGRRRYTGADLAVAHAVVRRAALAVDNAHLYEASEVGSRAKTDFLAVVSHELKTPLNAITGYAALLQEMAAGLTEDQRGYLGRIRERAADLLEIVEQMITVAQLETGRERPELAETDLAALVERVAAAAAAAARDKGLEFRLAAVEAPLRVRTDPAGVERIVASLLSNAVKFTESGGVEVRVYRVPGGAAVEVRDTGIGIAPEHLEAVFEPFWQVDRGLTRAWEGVGLGLTVARRLAQLLGGGIEARSAPAEGSAFVLRLPEGPPPR